MTGIEALKALRDGKNVKSARWHENEVLYGRPNGRFVTEFSGKILPSITYTMNRWSPMTDHRYLDTLIQNALTDFLADDWEVVE